MAGEGPCRRIWACWGLRPGGLLARESSDDDDGLLVMGVDRDEAEISARTAGRSSACAAGGALACTIGKKN